MDNSLEEYLAILNQPERALFTPVADFAFSLGYRARRDKTRDLNFSFLHRQVKPLILRYSILRGRPVIRLKFFAAGTYSRFFEDALKTTIEEYEFRYTGCYGCEKCDGSHGYTIRYRDGREYFRCGLELIDLPGLSSAELPELLDLFRRQHEFYLGQQ